MSRANELLPHPTLAWTQVPVILKLVLEVSLGIAEPKILDYEIGIARTMGSTGRDRLQDHRATAPSTATEIRSIVTRVCRLGSKVARTLPPQKPNGSRGQSQGRALASGPFKAILSP